MNTTRHGPWMLSIGLLVGTVAVVPADEPPSPKVAKLEDWPDATTRAAVAHFTRRIQPLLLNSCGTGACHGERPGAERPFLLQRGLASGVNAQITQTNLARTLAWVDPDRLEASLLLRKGLDAHGGLKRPPLGGLDGQAYLVLRDWLGELRPTPTTTAAPLINASPTEPVSPPGERAGFAQDHRPIPGYTRPQGTAEMPAVVASTTPANTTDSIQATPPPEQTILRAAAAQPLGAGTLLPKADLPGAIQAMRQSAADQQPPAKPQMPTGRPPPPPGKPPGTSSQLPVLPGLTGRAAQQTPVAPVKSAAPASP